MNLFQRGLTNRLNNCIFSFDPQHQNWDDLKRHAMLASNAEANIRALNQQPFGQNFGNYKGRQGNRVFGDRPQKHQYNSTNAPPSHNNRVIPMDIGRAKGWRTGSAQENATTPVENNATQSSPRSSKAPLRSTKFQGKCWHCNTPGHTWKECRKLQREMAVSANWEGAQQADWQSTNDGSSSDGPNPIDRIIHINQSLETALIANLFWQMTTNCRWAHQLAYIYNYANSIWAHH
jgi:hypothetical protein